MTTRRHFLAGLSTAAAATWTQRLTAAESPADIILGHGSHRYRLQRDWVDPRLSKHFPVLNCHEMVRSKDGRLFMSGDHPQAQLFVMDQTGRILESFGQGWLGGHGLSLGDENGEEFLYLTDCGVWKVGTEYLFQTGSVIKMDLRGNQRFIISHPAAFGAYTPEMKFNPTETAIAPNGDIYVADGYGSGYILRYNHQGQFIQKFGAEDGPQEQHLHQPHGVAVDLRSGLENATLIVTSRLDQCLRRFTLDGKYLSTIALPGAYVCRPVIAGQHLYAGVCWSQKADVKPLGGIDGIDFAPSGFTLVLDAQDHVISAPGGNAPHYQDGQLQPLSSAAKNIIAHGHDVHILENGDLIIMQWNAEQTYPLRLEKLPA